MAINIDSTIYAHEAAALGLPQCTWWREGSLAMTQEKFDVRQPNVSFDAGASGNQFII